MIDRYTLSRKATAALYQVKTVLTPKESRRKFTASVNGSSTIGELRYSCRKVIFGREQRQQRQAAAEVPPAPGPSSAIRSLLEMLSGTDHYENANALLYANFNLTLCQIEDWHLYPRVDRLLTALTPAAESDYDRPALAAALNYQQKKRSATLLGNIPVVLDQVKDPDKSRPAGALLTVGLAHIEEIIQFLLNGKARIAPLPGAGTEFSGYYCDLHALNNDYGITIILPRTLADNSSLLQFAMPEF